MPPTGWIRTADKAMIDLPGMTPPLKRSVTIEGHRTSVSLEEAFWQELGRIATDRDETRATLIARIDRARPPEVGLATAIRLFVLADLRRG
ncbi:Ribbon-helix-helix domain-containing protein [Paracoccus alcaliphilus]|uniref:Ribbon-helix-helix domain-containing protein n=2 Tax=Paracoccus alcaliphilus TaxID=34002 RepID=A0A1H8DV57_9RHOB|nr:Ribbon-helix-helix domain-containing protein [Paracoccus alcaliphilus]